MMDREDGVYERLSKNKSRLLLCFNEICFLNIIVMGFFFLYCCCYFLGIFFCVGGMQNLERVFFCYIKSSKLVSCLHMTINNYFVIQFLVSFMVFFSFFKSNFQFLKNLWLFLQFFSKKFSPPCKNWYVTHALDCCYYIKYDNNSNTYYKSTRSHVIKIYGILKYHQLIIELIKWNCMLRIIKVII